MSYAISQTVSMGKILSCV